MTLQDIYIEERLEDQIIKIEINGNIFEIFINQGSSFGANHSTTSLSISAIKFVISNEEKIINNSLDFGSGSGILSIVMKKLGILKVSAYEIDKLAIKESILNFKSNFNKKDYPLTIENPLFKDYKYDLIVSNISGTFLPNNLYKITEIINIDGYLIISGFNEEKKEKYINLGKELNLKLVKTFIKSPWISIILKKTK